MRNIINWKKSMPVGYGPIQNPMTCLRHEIDNALNCFYHLFDVPSASFTDIEKLVINPSVDIVEDAETFKVEVEIPGMGEADIKVTINDRILTIQGKKKISSKNTGKNYISREIGYGNYERQIALPDYVNVDNAKASFKKGMLWVVFSKNENSEKMRRKIKVEKAVD